MKHVTPFRAAAVFLVLFCFAHTAGGMLSQKSLGPAADEVLAQMKAVHFDFFGADCTWYGFWFGFGMTTSLFLLLSAIVVWQLDKVAATAWAPLAPVGWALVVAHGINTFLSWKYFFPGPVTFGVLTTALMTWGTMRKAKASAPHMPGAPTHPAAPHG